MSWQPPPSWQAAIDRVDQRVDGLFEPLRRQPGTDGIAFWASELADFSVGWHLINAGVALARPDLESKAVRMALTLGFESILVNGMIKPIFDRERPDGWQETGGRAVRRPKTASFPSGHASSGAVAAVLLSDAVPRLKPIWWSLAAVVAGSRIHTRMHHASDVAAGAAVGAAIGLAARRIWA